MKILRLTLTKIMLGLMASSLFAVSAYAQAYGQGNYGGSVYSSGLVKLGPVVLPVTGPQLLGISSAAAVAVAIGLLVWMRERRKVSSQN